MTITVLANVGACAGITFVPFQYVHRPRGEPRVQLILLLRQAPPDCPQQPVHWAATGEEEEEVSAGVRLAAGEERIVGGEEAGAEGGGGGGGALERIRMTISSQIRGHGTIKAEEKERATIHAIKNYLYVTYIHPPKKKTNLDKYLDNSYEMQRKQLKKTFLRQDLTLSSASLSSSSFTRTPSQMSFPMYSPFPAHTAASLSSAAPDSQSENLGLQERLRASEATEEDGEGPPPPPRQDGQKVSRILAAEDLLEGRMKLHFHVTKQICALCTVIKEKKG